MEFDILDSLDDLGYCGLLKSDDDIIDCIEKGTKSIEFIELVHWLSKELQSLNNMESCIHSVTDVEDSSSFLLELSSFLKETHCPYKSLTNGPISQRLIDIQNRRILLDYLCTELLTARLLHARQKKNNFMEIEVDDSSTALSLYSAIKTLNINTDSIDLNPDATLAEIENKLRTLIESKLEDISPPIISETLSEQQWESLSSLYEEFFSDYTVRRKLLLTRLDVTIQSFKWGESSKGKENKILEAYLSRSKMLKPQPAVRLSDVIAARENLLIVEKTSSASLVKNTKSTVNTVLIPPVPDRGGRPKEQRPPVEMPSWAKRSHSSGQGNQHGGGDWRGKGKKFHSDQNARNKKGRKKGNFGAAGSY